MLLLSGPINKLVMHTGSEVRVIVHVPRMLIGTRSLGHAAQEYRSHVCLYIDCENCVIGIGCSVCPRGEGCIVPGSFKGVVEGNSSLGPKGFVCLVLLYWCLSEHSRSLSQSHYSTPRN